MGNVHVIAGAGETPAYPVVRKIGLSDLNEALAKGFEDFAAIPTHVLFLGVIYPLVGLFLFRVIVGYDLMTLLFPLAAGFALIGPFASVGLYELSRRREQGLEARWTDAFDVFRSPSRDAIFALGLLLMAIFLVWLGTAQALYHAFFGPSSPASISSFARDVLTAPAGWGLIVIGNGVGLLFAILVLVISVVSFPLLLDREVGAAVAVHTSFRAVIANPLPMAAWGLIVAAALVIGAIPCLLGLAVVIPVLGHSTWHLYRRAVDASASPPTEYRERPKARRFAADFPAALFPVPGEAAREPSDDQGSSSPR
jgi:uncharacterized membrane protein